MKNYLYSGLLFVICINKGNCMSVIQTSLGVKYHRNINTSIDITTWKIGSLNEMSLISCMMMCMQADNCFWSTFNSDVCDLLSITKTDMVDLNLIVRNGGLQIYQMIRGCSKKACRLLDGCVFLQNYGYCMKYYVRHLSYESARTVCRQDGGKLFRIDSDRKQLAMEHILSSELSLTDDVIVQGTKDSQGRWLFDDGTPMTYFKWNSPDGQPSNGPTERYIHIKTSIQCFWHDFGIAERPFLCQIHENN